MKKVLALLFALFLPVCARADSLEWIDIAENAALPDEASVSSEYPASVVPGEQLYDLEHLLNTLLGEDYLGIERGEYDHADEYRSAGGDEPWEYRRASVEDDDQSFSYYNPWIIGERGGEYEAPGMGMTPSESIVLCRAQLSGVVPEEWIAAPNELLLLRDRWDYSDRWMTEAEYAAFTAEKKAHYFTFNHLTDAGIPIASDRIYASIGADGLASLSVCWRDFTESDETISPMPLAEALTLANSTRSAPCTLLSARLVYSSWLTEDGTHNLSWQLFTDAGTYIVDCVLEKHMCDSYEY